MVRAPCCEKMGLKRGPWTTEEDTVLIAFIQRYGHGNWRALPKQAGLLRCGKSCRLRWTNYLRPDIKRGNFSIEEEETIIKLHEILGNRWSAIAARLPGRTDNEIKNVWHTHLKKRLKKNETSPETRTKPADAPTCETGNSSTPEPEPEPEPRLEPESEPEPEQEEVDRQPQQPATENSSSSSVSPQQSSSDFSCGTDSSSNITTDDNGMSTNESLGTMAEYNELSSDFFDIDENFCLNMLAEYSPSSTIDTQLSNCSNMDDGMDFWFDLFLKAEEPPVLSEF